MGWRERLGVGDTGTSLRDELNVTLDSIAARAQERHQAVRVRLAELEAESSLLRDIRERVR